MSDEIQHQSDQTPEEGPPSEGAPPAKQVSQPVFGYPANMMPPLDQIEMGRILFERMCAIRELMPLKQGPIQRTIEQTQALLAERYFGVSPSSDGEQDADISTGPEQETDPVSSPDFSLDFLGGAVDSDGVVYLLAVIEDNQTGNFVLPVMTLDRDEEDNTTVGFNVGGGAKSFQGIVVSLHPEQGPQSEATDSSIVVREAAFLPSHLTVIELSRFAQGDFHTPVRNQIERLLQSHQASTLDVALIRPSQDTRYPVTSMRYLLDTKNEENQPRTTFLVNVGDFDGSGLIDSAMVVKFVHPGHPDWIDPNGKSGVEPSESLLSNAEALGREHNSVPIEGAEAHHFYRIDEVKYLVESMLLDSALSLWEKDDGIDVRVESPRISPDGKVRLFVSLCKTESAEAKELDTDDQSDTAPKQDTPNQETQSFIPWIPAGGKATGVLESGSFIALAVEVEIPHEVLTDLNTPLSEVKESISIEIPHAIVPQNTLWRAIHQLADRDVVQISNGEADGVIYREGPSEKAKQSVFFQEVRATIVSDLVEQGHITAPQAMGVDLKNIKVSPEYSMTEGLSLAVDAYFVHVDHQWGTHILKINRLPDFGAVPLEGTVSIDGFFPRRLFLYESEMEAMSE